jgi:hypothetical protein
MAQQHDYVANAIQELEPRFNELKGDIALLAESISGLIQPDNDVDVLAVDDLPKFIIATADGKIANSSDITQMGKVLGIVWVAAHPGFMSRVRILGQIENTAWSWAPGAILYLNGTSISATAPTTGFSVKIGYASAPTKIIIELGEQIMF